MGSRLTGRTTCIHDAHMRLLCKNKNKNKNKNKTKTETKTTNRNAERLAADCPRIACSLSMSALRLRLHLRLRARHGTIGACTSDQTMQCTHARESGSPTDCLLR